MKTSKTHQFISIHDLTTSVQSYPRYVSLQVNESDGCFTLLGSLAHGAQIRPHDQEALDQLITSLLAMRPYIPVSSTSTQDHDTITSVYEVISSDYAYKAFESLRTIAEYQQLEQNTIEYLDSRLFSLQQISPEIPKMILKKLRVYYAQDIYQFDQIRKGASVQAWQRIEHYENEYCK